MERGEPKYARYVRFIDSNVQMAQLKMLADPAAALLQRRQEPERPMCGGACEWMINNVVRIGAVEGLMYMGEKQCEDRPCVSNSGRSGIRWTGEGAVRAR